MLEVVAKTFQQSHTYGNDERTVLKSTMKQIQTAFSNENNLLINMTWFGPQFDNGSWKQIESFVNNNRKFDNLFLLNVLDPVYVTPEQIQWIEKNLNIKKTYYIGGWENSALEWNFHAVVTARHWPSYSNQQLLMTQPDHVFVCYQRKPRAHRIEFTNLLLQSGLHKNGIVTLGGDNTADHTFGEGLYAPNLKIDDPATDYTPDGPYTLFGGVPNDLVSVGRLDVWQRHFLNIVSETEFNQWHRLFVTEKVWKPIAGLRPFVIHGQTRIYSWLKSNGFKTFNHYWSHIPCETGEDQHGNVINVIDFLCNKNKNELISMYTDMLPDLIHNQQRFFEFAVEQQHRMDHVFQ